jgi:mRNA interferase RelE/StbE
MAWTFEFTPNAQKQLDDLDKTISRRILKFLYERVGQLENPRQIGDRLQGTLSKFWKYRVGDYRIICSMEDKKLVVVVLRIGHRREIYKR